MRPYQAIRAGMFSLCLFLVVLVIVLLESSMGDANALASATTATAAQGAGAVDRSEIERRLALPPFAYVAETDHDTAKLQQGLSGYNGATAFIDSLTDSLVARPLAGASPQEVAVAPDGSLFYVTDGYEPVLHVLDAETRQEIREIALPGVRPRDPASITKAYQAGTFAYDVMRSCSSGVACTPDGSSVLVCSSAGLQVVDTATNRVVRTLSDLPGGFVAVSFDGKRAYVASDTLDSLAPRGFFDWVKTFTTAEECRLVCLDLETWQIAKEIPTGLVASIAVKPDDSQIFFSESYQKRVRVVDALTLEDLWEVSTKPSFSVGIGFVPNGTKAYVVCTADSGFYDMSAQTAPKAPTAEDFFCAVIDTAGKEIIKRIPLEAY